MQLGPSLSLSPNDPLVPKFLAGVVEDTPLDSRGRFQGVRIVWGVLLWLAHANKVGSACRFEANSNSGLVAVASGAVQCWYSSR